MRKSFLAASLFISLVASITCYAGWDDEVLAFAHLATKNNPDAVEGAKNLVKILQEQFRSEVIFGHEESIQEKVQQAIIDDLHRERDEKTRLLASESDDESRFYLKRRIKSCSAQIAQAQTRYGEHALKIIAALVVEGLRLEQAKEVGKCCIQ